MSDLIHTLRADFPALAQQVNGKPLVYLDNGATTHKPQAVIDAISQFYAQDNSNVHRGAHTLSDRATQAFEQARETVRDFLNAGSTKEIIWTRGTTEAINLVAHSFGAQLQAGDQILISAMEHHANIVPWQMLCERSGAELKVIPVTERGELDMPAFDELLTDKVKLVGVVHVSNALGTINPIEDIIAKAHAVGAKVLIDGAQSVAHWDIDVRALDADFFAFSGHKLFGPTGIGVLYGKQALLEAMPPYQTGGEMIEHVSFSSTRFNGLPFKFESGTPNIAGAIGLAAAIRYLNQLDRDALLQHEYALLARLRERASDMPELRLIGDAEHKASIFGFVLNGAHPADVGTLLDQQGIAVRTGHHCAMPIMEQFGVPGSVRASFSFYNTLDEVDALFTGLEKAKLFLL
ncbi:cysteine desulfurase [Bacterioplanes sanyensis]|uniref:aminotransferase class V-fold PLP-dependent enzyme n=1 Tax=Bacterioplanes sanyensis TaxID=1249553 RepID=UPI0016727651|nr:cysteine desulfurase [Bacterioplanes sanyensis]GGY33630.1 cysteine desulfurase [Bacterioplanes sanyensis]